MFGSVFIAGVLAVCAQADPRYNASAEVSASSLVSGPGVGAGRGVSGGSAESGARLAKLMDIARRTHGVEAEESLAHSLEVIESGDPATPTVDYVTALFHRSWALQAADQPVLAEKDAHSALCGAVRLGRTDLVARGHYQVGLARWRQSDNVQALVAAERARDLQEENGWRSDLATTLSLLGTIQLSLGNLESAFDRHQESLRISEELGDELGIARAQGNLGVLYWKLGDKEKADACFRSTLGVYERAGLDVELATSLTHLARLHVDSDELDEALPYFERSLMVCRASGSSQGYARALANLGKAHERLGEPEVALERHREALEVWKQSGDPAGTLTSSNDAARLLLEQGSADAAIRVLDEALEAVEGAELPAEESGLRLTLAQALKAAGDSERAVEEYQRAHELMLQMKGDQASERIAKAEMRVEAELHERELEVLRTEREFHRSELERQRANVSYLVLGSVLLAVACCAFYFMYRSRVRAMDALAKSVERVRELELDRMRAEKLESLGLLAGGIAHDFNNALTAIGGHVALARYECEEGSRASLFLDKAEKAASHAGRLTTQLLAFSKGGSPLLRPRAVRPLLEKAIAVAASDSKLALELDIADDLANAELDDDQFSQAVTGLVANADEAMPEGGALHVRASNFRASSRIGPAAGPGDYVRIEFRDEGTGIAEAIRSRVIDPYFTTKDAGSGMGLSTAFAVMARHGGCLDIDSEVGRGTTVTLYVPACGRTTSEGVLESVEGAVPKGDRSLRVLVLEDEPLVQSVYEAALGGMGHEFVIHSDGADVVREYFAAREAGRPFDLIVMDLTVPGGMGGQAAMAKIRARDPDVRAIVASGYSEDRVMADYREEGFCAALPKPFRVPDLLLLIESQVPSEEQQRPLARS